MTFLTAHDSFPTRSPSPVPHDAAHHAPLTCSSQDLIEELIGEEIEDETDASLSPSASVTRASESGGGVGGGKAAGGGKTHVRPKLLAVDGPACLCVVTCDHGVTCDHCVTCSAVSHPPLRAQHRCPRPEAAAQLLRRNQTGAPLTSIPISCIQHAPPPQVQFLNYITERRQAPKSSIGPGGGIVSSVPVACVCCVLVSSTEIPFSLETVLVVSATLRSKHPEVFGPLKFSDGALEA